MKAIEILSSLFNSVDVFSVLCVDTVRRNWTMVTSGTYPVSKVTSGKLKKKIFSLFPEVKSLKEEERLVTEKFVQGRDVCTQLVGDLNLFWFANILSSMFSSVWKVPF